MNKFLFARITLIISLSTFLISCSESNEFEISNDYYLENFKLNQLDIKGMRLFSLLSTKASIDPISNDIKADNVIIELSGTEKIFTTISADKFSLNKAENLLELHQDVKLFNSNNKDSFLTANNFKWNIRTNNIELEGNISINYYSTQLNSKKAYYNNVNEEIIFTGVSNYKYLTKSNNKSTQLLTLTADIAKISNKTKSIEFSSPSKQVQSVIQLINN